MGPLGVPGVQFTASRATTRAATTAVPSSAKPTPIRSAPEQMATITALSFEELPDLEISHLLPTGGGSDRDLRSQLHSLVELGRGRPSVEGRG